jgi:hypothetical protein
MAVLDDNELAFVFNLLNSDDVKISGAQSRNLEIIKSKIVQHLQPSPAAPQKEEDGDSTDTPE